MCIRWVLYYLFEIYIDNIGGVTGETQMTTAIIISLKNIYINGVINFCIEVDNNKYRSKTIT